MLATFMDTKETAHAVALRNVYPILFGTTRITSIGKPADRGAYFYELRYRGQMGVCATTVYEIFRSAENARYRSLTLTHMAANGTISDQLHRNYAQLTTQGFYNPSTGQFTGPLVVVSLADVICRIQTGHIPFKLRNIPRSVCTYVEVLIEDLAPFAMFVKEY